MPSEVPSVVSAWPSSAARADLSGHRDRLLAPGLCLGMVGQQHEELAVRGQCARQRPGWRLGGDGGHRPLDGGQRLGAVAGEPVVTREALEQRAGALRLRDRVEEVQRQANQHDRPVVVAGEVGHLARRGAAA
jgi:hypothetical protein